MSVRLVLVAALLFGELQLRRRFCHHPHVAGEGGEAGVRLAARGWPQGCWLQSPHPKLCAILPPLGVGSSSSRLKV